MMTGFPLRTKFLFLIFTLVYCYFGLGFLVPILELKGLLVMQLAGALGLLPVAMGWYVLTYFAPPQVGRADPMAENLALLSAMSAEAH